MWNRADRNVGEWPACDARAAVSGEVLPDRNAFIVFDIEIVFLYPWAVSYDALGTFALVEMVVFMLTVFVAYAYVWRRGSLTWD